MTSYGTWNNGSAAVRGQPVGVQPPHRRPAGPGAQAGEDGRPDRAGEQGPARLGELAQRPDARRRDDLDARAARRAASPNAAPVTGADGGYVSFNTSGKGNNTVLAKVGISYVSTPTRPRTSATRSPAGTSRRCRAPRMTPGTRRCPRSRSRVGRTPSRPCSTPRSTTRCCTRTSTPTTTGSTWASTGRSTRRARTIRSTPTTPAGTSTAARASSRRRCSRSRCRTRSTR